MCSETTNLKKGIYVFSWNQLKKFDTPIWNQLKKFGTLEHIDFVLVRELTTLLSVELISVQKILSWFQKGSRIILSWF